MKAAPGMDRIIAAHVGSQLKAQHVADSLMEAGIPRGDMDVSYVPPPGQHATYPIGGDVSTDEGAKAAPGSAVKGVAIGAAAGAVAGGVAAVAAAPIGGVALAPLVTAVGAGVGAHLGGLMGAMKGLGEAEEKHRQAQRAQAEEEGGTTESSPLDSACGEGLPLVHERRGGLMLAVRVADPAKEETILDILYANDARDIEAATGRWDNGTWADFDPLSEPQWICADYRSEVRATAGQS